MAFLLFLSVFLSILFWAYGNRQSFSFPLKIPKTAILSSPSPTPTPTPKIDPAEGIKKEISNLTKDLKGEYGIYVYNLTTREGFGIKENEVFTAASINKLPVILTLYQEAEAGRLDLETKYALLAQDKRGGAGSMQYKPLGTVYTYRQMVELMAKQSDNTAFAALRRILTDEKIQDVIDNLGMKKTSLKESLTSPSDIGLFFRKFYSGSLLSRKNRDEIIGFLTKTAFEDRIPAGLPAGTAVAHKIGSEIGVVSDAGIVFSPKPYILVILSKDVNEKEALTVLPKISRAVWEFENK